MDTLWKDLSTSIHGLPFDDNQRFSCQNQADDDPLISTDSPPSSSNTDPLDDNPLDTILLNYISEILMEEEDLCEKQDSVAVQAAEKSFYEALLDTSSSSPQPSVTQTSSNDTSCLSPRDLLDANYQALDDHEVTPLSGRKNHLRDDGLDQGRSRKQPAIAIGGDQEEEQSDLFDEVLLKCESEEFQNQPQVATKKKKKKQETKEQFVDLETLLTLCAQAVSISDHTTAFKLLKQIQQHTSPSGDGTQRLAYYFAKALEIRVAGTTAPAYVALANNKTPFADLLRAYQAYILASPYYKMSHFFASKTIMKLAEQATTVHVIDFGIDFGVQWPSLIERLSARTGGPPKLRITGIEFPQPGFRPAKRVEETGRRLKQYCDRFNISFEFNGIAKQWETITLDDLETKNNELIVVNSLYRYRNLPDDTISSISARDKVLNLIKSINPSVVIQGELNSTHSGPFFLTRFREALFTFSSTFDMLDANLSREDERRMILEREMFGTDIMNVIACEGAERMNRPETYKQWQARSQRAGLQQLPLDMELVKKVRSLVRSGYHKEYSVEVDGQWMVQAWKGKVRCAISCWKPLNTSS